jgi:hypothetical protein
MGLATSLRFPLARRHLSGYVETDLPISTPYGFKPPKPTGG